ncbi:MAG: tail fiber domain-containing protein [Flavobacteriales bacterium]|nr:tail fiber domain-containing protein [Flavobacteriales bacterium]
MKLKLFAAVAVLFSFCFFSDHVAAQSPQMFNYQGVARDNAGNTLTNQSLTLRTSILADSPSGTIVYQETHGVNTNQLGIFNLQIGNGSVVSGDIQTIDWGSTTHFMQVEMDPNGANDFQNLGTSQLLSVPYALYAETTGNKSLSDNDEDTKIQVEENADEDIIRFDIAGTEQLRIQNSPNGAPILDVNSVGGNLYLGYGAGYNDASGSQNTFLGQFAGISNSVGTHNTFVGFEAGTAHVYGDGNTFVGVESGRNNVYGIGNVFIGSAAGYNEVGSDKLYIANSNTSTPLIYGDFAADSLSVNGSFTAKDDFAQSGRFIATLINTQDDTYANGLKIHAGENSQSVNNRFISFVRPDGSEIGAVRQITSSSVDFWSPSDRRLKTKIQSTAVGLAELMQLQVKDYVYKDDLSKPQTGFIAQEVFEVFPNAVSVGGDDVKTDPWMMNYGKLTPLLVKAIQDQQVEIEFLKTQNEAILNELKELKNN